MTLVAGDEGFAAFHYELALLVAVYVDLPEGLIIEGLDELQVLGEVCEMRGTHDIRK